MCSTSKQGSPTRSLDDPVQHVPGVGPQGASLLKRLGIQTAGDLLFHIPRRYEDRSTFCAISNLRVGEAALIKGSVIAVEGGSTRRRGIPITRVTIRDATGAAELVFFNQSYVERRFRGMLPSRKSVIVYGAVRQMGFGIPSIERPEWEEASDADPLSWARIVPIYSLSEGLTQARLRRTIAAALREYADCVQDVLPLTLRERNRLMPAAQALRSVHFPDDLRETGAARRSLVFEEFLLLQLAFALQRSGREAKRTPHVIAVDNEALAADVARVFPFEPTDSQRQAIRDIASDMSSGRPMNRLLHGDVGSGKTAVAVAAILMAIRGGLQSAIMAPTEVLAQQHSMVLREWLAPIEITVELAIGSMGARPRSALRQRLASGEARVVVGTHALIEDDVGFHRLGLAVVDEQHRFGVLQRRALQDKAVAPHVLIMSATPIPRTLTLTLYGDLDVTCLRDMPPGRRPIRTYWKRPEQARATYDGVRQLLEQGRQAYVVCPLVEESEKLEAAAATQHADRIRSEMLPGWRVGLLHGQMPAQQKDDVMRAFKQHDIDVLVSTTVIEVGVDVPNAAVMVVEDADRFGLAQLHQLRGRVGRGAHASYCILMANPRTEDGERRLRVMVETTDGFRIAQEDLELRGPGEFYGTRQSGLPAFRFGDILQDEDVLIETRQAAVEMIAADPELLSPEHARLRAAVVARMASLDLVEVS